MDAGAGGELVASLEHGDGSAAGGTPDPVAGAGRRARPSAAAGLAIAILIASTSVLGAIVAWRSADALDAASSAEEQALVRQAAREEADMRSDAYVDTAQLDYLRVRGAIAHAAALRRLARAAPESAVRRALLDQAGAYAHAGATVRLHIDPSALTSSGTLELARVRRVYDTEQATAVPLDPGPPQHQAELLQEVAGRLKTLALGSILAAFFLTLAQVSRTRAWRLYCAVGVALLLALVGELIATGLG
jgi:hypothetical protein